MGALPFPLCDAVQGKGRVCPSRLLPRQTCDVPGRRPRHDALSEPALEGTGRGGVALHRIGQRGREQRALARIEPARGFSEIALRRCFDPKKPVAPFGDVE